MTDYNLVPPFKALVDGVREYLQANGVTARVERGWKARASQINQGPGRANRVVFSGSKPDGGAGRFVKPRQVGERILYGAPNVPEATMRSLGDWQRLIYVSIWAYDGDRKESEGAQDDALYSLFLWTIRAVHAVTFGNAEWGGISISVPLERGFGLEILTDLTFQHQMPDVPEALAFPGGRVLASTTP